MAETAQFKLPLVAPAQAQKHVTVNEALARLDAMAQMRLESTEVLSPPSGASDGESYLVPPGATGDWADQQEKIAIRSNGGWAFVIPKPGWRAWDAARFASTMFDGSKWLPDATAISSGGAGTVQGIIEFDHLVVPGASNLTSTSIPAMSQLSAVTGRVVSAISGSGLTGWRIGVPGADNRYGSGLGVALNSYLVGMTGAPVTYYSDTPLLLSADGGSFAAGTVRLALHLIQVVPPTAA